MTKNTNARWRIISFDCAHFQNTNTLHAPARNDFLELAHIHDHMFNRGAYVPVGHAV